MGGFRGVCMGKRQGPFSRWKGGVFKEGYKSETGKKEKKSLRGVREKVLREKERKVKEKADRRNPRKEGGS